MLKAHLSALQEAGAHPLCGVCWHLTHDGNNFFLSVLLDAEAQLIQVTGLVAAVDSALSGCPKPVIQQLEIKTVSREEPAAFRFPWR